ncbi:MAG: phosphoenolpyruvate--protein phosphotransferase [Herbinix sp.]|jgi:phosphotransferase system enzyme I (PtsI)|nr:phosphoenolpyruvate--protein phosphotransferase [Herbinix sp.]
MQVFTGIGVNGGIAIGQFSMYQRKVTEIVRKSVEDVDSELTRFQEALEKTVVHLRKLYEKAVSEVGEATAMIFEVHQMMIEDREYIASVENIIRAEKVNAEYAVDLTAINLSNIFSSMDNEYMKERAVDIKDVSKKLLSFLQDNASEEIKMNKPVILAADDLVPSETVQLDRTMILGFITQQGSANSHTAILARTMDIPAVVGVNIELNSELEGKLAVIDGFDGRVYIEPEQEVLMKLMKKQLQDNERKSLLKQLKGKESITKDGQVIKIYANIGNSEDIDSVLNNDAEGIGLFRSEFLYLKNDTYPTEEEQFVAYRTVAEKMSGKKVIIRTLDIGADKKVDYFNLDKEENPALGYRAIRICLDRNDLFKTQLRAIYRASMYGKISIMFPMIISLEEVRKIKVIIEEVKKELGEEGISFAEVELGIMIETPAAALISDILAKEVDFFSIGTNDLTQYTLAIDRQNQKLDKLYDPYHPAVLRLIDVVAHNAHDNGIWVGICGELAGDLTMTETFLQMEIDELSVAPSKVLALRNEVINFSSK